MTRTATPPQPAPASLAAAAPTSPGPTPPTPSRAEPGPDRRERLLAPYRNLPPWIAVTQLFFGLGWLRAAGAKVIDPNWWTGDTIRRFVADHQDLTLPWIEPLLTVVVLPAAALVAVVVVVLQVAVGSALALNRAVMPALLVASTLNLVFVAIGAVNPSAFYLVGQGAVALWYLGRRSPSPGLSRGLQFGVAIAVALAVISVPFIGTVHPAEVIDDPAIMMVTLAGLTALAAELTHRALFRRGLP